MPGCKFCGTRLGVTDFTSIPACIVCVLTYKFAPQRPSSTKGQSKQELSEIKKMRQRELHDYLKGTQSDG